MARHTQVRSLTLYVEHIKRLLMYDNQSDTEVIAGGAIISLLLVNALSAAQGHIKTIKISSASSHFKTSRIPSIHQAHSYAKIKQNIHTYIHKSQTQILKS